MTKPIGPEAKLFNAVDEIKEATKEAHATLKQLNHSINDARKLNAEFQKMISDGLKPIVGDRMDEIQRFLESEQRRMASELIECIDNLSQPLKSAMESHS